MDKTALSDKQKLVAYSVQGDEYGCVIFARSNVIARREGASELGIEFRDITSCRRMPEADRYAEQGKVPKVALVDEFGWWQECAFCSSMVSAEGNADRVWSGETIFCDQDCQRKYRAREARNKAEREAQLAKQAEIKELAISRFPGITNIQVYKEWDDGHRVYFNFPGGKRAASWLVGREEINVSECDVEAGKAFMDKIRVQR